MQEPAHYNLLSSLSISPLPPTTSSSSPPRFIATQKQKKEEEYITKKISLDNIVAEGFNTLTGLEKKKQVKILVTPDEMLLDK